MQSDTAEDRDVAARKFLGGAIFPGPPDLGKLFVGINFPRINLPVSDSLAKMFEGITFPVSESLVNTRSGPAYTESNNSVEMLKAVSGSAPPAGSQEVEEPEFSRNV